MTNILSERKTTENILKYNYTKLQTITESLYLFKALAVCLTILQVMLAIITHPIYPHEYSLE